MDLYKSTAHELHDKLVNKEISSVELTKALYERIDAVEDQVKAYVTLDKENALAQAAKVDAMIAAGEKIAPLAGIPGAIKDNICTKGLLTTCSSKMLANVVPIYDAHVIKKLRAEETIFLGKTNMDEFAMGSTTESSYFQATQPASFNGCVGIKPTYGRVSRYGCVAFASSLDQIGPITRDVTDAATVLNTICGKDEHDSTSLPVEVPDFTKALRQDVKGLRIGLPKEYYGEGLDPKVHAELKKAIAQYEAMGAEIVEISLPHTEYAVITYYIIAPAEASANLARYDGVRYGFRAANATSAPEMTTLSRTEGFGAEVKRRIMLGTYVLSSGYYDAYYKKAMQVRTLIRRDFDSAFEKCDVILAPTSPVVAYPIDGKMDPLSIYMLDVYTIPVNMAGLPGISVPCGFADGMPVGMQLIGKPLDEETVLRAAYTFEQANEYHKVLAPLGGNK